MFERRLRQVDKQFLAEQQEQLEKELANESANAGKGANCFGDSVVKPVNENTMSQIDTP
jgi:hypothetical protein